MKSSQRFQKIFLVGSLLAATVAMNMPADAQPVGPPERTISTQGHGEVKIRPDSLNLSASVEANAPTMAQVRAAVNQKMQKVIAAIKGLNIPNTTLQTQFVQVYPVYGPQEKNRVAKIIGYRSVNSLSVTVTRASAETLAEYGTRIVDTALNAGAENVGGLNFYVDDISTPRAQALELAVKDARRNAEAMARGANLTLTGVYSLEGFPQYGGGPRPMPMYSMKSAEAADAPSTPVETGESTITSEVNARFKF